MTNRELAPDLSTKGCFPKAWIRIGTEFRLLKDGGEDNGVNVEVRISWDAGEFREYRNLVYTNEMLGGVVSAGQRGAFVLTVSGFSAIEGISEITVEAVARSSTGVACISQGIIVTLPNA